MGTLLRFLDLYVRSNDHTRCEILNGCGHALSKKSEHDWIILHLFGIVLGIIWLPRIYWPWFGVVHPSSSQFAAEVGGVVRDAVAFFDEWVNLSRRPWLVLFEDRTEFLPWSGEASAAGRRRSLGGVPLRHCHATHVPIDAL